jgi:Family of unknown function (DUF6152)
MKIKSVVMIFTVLVLLMASGSLFAHHGTAVSYNIHKVLVLKGVVTSFAFSNPHSQLYFDVTDEKGKVTSWAAEMRNPRNLQAFGHTKKELNEKFAPGTRVTVTGNPSKSGAPVLVFGKAVLADGWCLCDHEGGVGSDAPGAPIQGEAAEGQY